MKCKLLLISGFVIQCLNISAQSVNEAVKAIEYDRQEKAIQVLKNALRSNAANAEAYYYLGDIYLDQSKIDSSKLMFGKGLVADPQNPLNYIGMGKIALESDNSTEFKKQFDKAMSLTGPRDSRTAVLIAEAYINASNKKPQMAMAVINKALENDPKNPELLLLRGDAHQAMFNGGEAASDYEKSLQLIKSPKAYTRIGDLYSKARNYNEALAAYQNALKIDSTYSPAYRGLGELYYQAKKFDKAVETYKKYTVLADNSISARARYASFLFLNKEYQKATEIINDVIKKDSSNVIMKRLLGYSLYEQKEYEKARKYMEGFFSKSKKVIASDYEYYGRILSKLNQDSLAILQFKKGMELDPNKTDLYSDMAMSYNKLKNYNEAIKYFELRMKNAVKISPTDMFLLGRTYYMAQNYPKADSVFTKITEQQPKWIPGYSYKGRIQNALDNAEPKTFAAKPFYEKVVELGQTDPQKNKADLLEAYEFLSYVCIQQDNKACAKDYAQKMVDLDPENKKAKEMLKGLK